MTVVDVQVQDMSNGYSVVVKVKKADNIIGRKGLAKLMYDPSIDGQLNNPANKPLAKDAARFFIKSKFALFALPFGIAKTIL